MQKRGFTLIEVLVSITIVMAIMGMSVVVFQTAKNKKTAETVAREVADKLAEAHADAMVPLDTATNLTKVIVTCNNSTGLTEQYDSVGSAVVPLYIFPKNVDITCSFDELEFNADNGIELGQITTAGVPSVSVSRNSDTYKATINKMSGAVNVTKK